MGESIQLEQVKDCVQAMVTLQRSHNELIHPKWDEQDYPFNRAIWVECAELLDHFGWKWWKQQAADLPQVKLEIVDIWHFALSELMIHHREQIVDTVSESLFQSLQSNSSDLPFREAVEKVASFALKGKFEVPAFIEMMQALPMQFSELFKIYVDKNALNLFRQSQGYKEGTYIKSWFGREDNEHLTELTQGLSPTSSTYMDDLLVLLKERYHHVCKRAKMEGAT